MSDPFQTLGLEPTFDVDLAEIERRHRDLSRALHPDRYVGRPAAERRRALGHAIEVNDARRRLRDPVRRAESLLERLGLLVAEGEEPKADPGLLMEMMEYRERLAEARQTRALDAVNRLSGDVRERERRVCERLAAAFTRALSSSNGADSAETLLKPLGELRYLRRFLDEASAIEDEIA